MQEVPFAPGSAWLGKVWDDHFAFDACHPSVQIFPGSPPLESELFPACHTLFHALHISSLLNMIAIPVQMPCFSILPRKHCQYHSCGANLMDRLIST